MDIAFKRTEWTDGRGHFLMEGTADFPKARVTVSEPIDTRQESVIQEALTIRLEQLVPRYS